ncbi:IclR family transcriptional regulator [Phenylobacterium sp.]|jgi:DNA-binding IclR family transcriptional regulator|uniref:IclR family transcriptional regulator n=1 Tax=Phenylobacterium sp. TaxID=1871053 RepID=UPI002F40F1FF
MFSHNIVGRGQSIHLPPASRVRRPGDRRSLSRSATRALDVLELFGSVRRPLRAVDIAQALGLHASTTDQLLKTMVDSAHLVFEAGSKRYAPSPRLVRFGMWLTEGFFGDDRIRRVLEAVHDGSDEVVTLSTRNDLFMQILDTVEPRGDCLTAERGLRAPLFGTAIGGACLAGLSDAEIGGLIERARIPAAEAPTLLAGVQRIRETGYAFGGISVDDANRSIAMALPTPPAGVRLVLGLAGPAKRIQPNRVQLAALMRRCIDRWIG